MDAAAAAMPRPARGRLLAFALALAVATLDLWSKSAVFAAVGPGERVPLLGTQWLAFTAVENRGVMWGLFPGLHWLLPWLRTVAAVVVVSMLLGTPPRSRMTLVALGLVLGGAVGNVYDGFAFGAVRDFVLVDLDIPVFDPFPVFNVADSGICVGVALLAAGLAFERPAPE